MRTKIIFQLIDWPPVLSDHEVPQRAAVSGETGKLVESHSNVSILLEFLVTVVIAAIIGYSKLLITQPSHEHFHVASCL